MNSNMSYTGRVTVKVKGKPPVKTKNSGTETFFRVLHEILAQKLIIDQTQDTLAKHLPAKIDIQSNGDSVLLAKMFITSRDVTASSVMFSCLLNHTNISTNKQIAEEMDYVLYNSLGEELARAGGKRDSIQSVIDTPASQATITWEMAISNKSTSETENGGNE